VIRIREPIPSKRALFDIGVSGPIAGFVALLPFLVIGLMMSEVAPKPEVSITLGEPLLFKVLAKFIVGPLPEGHDVFLHPLGFAAWFGMFATVLNLMPFGQLDGGHIAHALFGKRSVYVSAVTLVAMVVLTIISRTWMLMTIVMLVMAFSLGIRHPYVPDDGPLDENRQLLAAVALVIFIICFIPVPIEVFFRSQG
jgi:membrane-associated protease RseP (regulator of RpoE activity)